MKSSNFCPLKLCPLKIQTNRKGFHYCQTENGRWNFYYLFLIFYILKFWPALKIGLKKKSNNPRSAWCCTHMVCWGSSSSLRQAGRSEPHWSKERQLGGGWAALPGDGRAERTVKMKGKQQRASTVRYAPLQVASLSLSISSAGWAGHITSPPHPPQPTA